MMYDACGAQLLFILVLDCFFQAGVQVADPVVDTFNGQEVEMWPRVTWRPKWAPTFSDVRRKVGGGCSISQKSTLVINGRDVHLEGLALDGSLVVNAVDQAEVCVIGQSPDATTVSFPGFLAHWIELC